MSRPRPLAGGESLALRRRLMGAAELRAWPCCEWERCSHPAMETLELCLAADGTRLLRPFRLCSQHAEALPLPLYRLVPPGTDG